MAKKYKGSLTLDWFNKQKAIVNLDENSIKGKDDIPAPRINWINKEEALFYELNEEEGKGNTPYWVNRDDIRVKEARPLIFQKAYKAIEQDKSGVLSGTDPEYTVQEITNEEDALDIDNMVIKGDNLIALRTIKKHLLKLTKNKKYKSILIDPPYNTKKAFQKYDDNLEHSEWLTLMRDRISILKELLSEDGILLVHIDDKENAYLKVLCDDIFGRDNFISTFIWETDGNSDNQAKIIGVHEYIHIYAKDINYFEYPSVFDPNIPEDSKIFRDSIINTIIKNGSKNPPSIVKLPVGFPAQFENGIIKKENVTYPKYNIDLVIENFKLINEVEAHTGWSSKSQLLNFIENNFNSVKDTKGQKTEFYLKNSGAIESIKKRDKVYGYVVSVLRNMGNPQSTAKQLKELYGVDFDFPKPEFLTSYLLDIFSDPGDYILDCFGGSGTTAAVSQKTNRNWTTVEIGNHADTHIVPRLNKIINGKDNIGITDSVNWQGGGSFKYYHLGESIINIDKETGKGEFNWVLGKQFIQESLLISYDFVLQEDINLFPAQLFQNGAEKPSLGKISNKGKAIYGVSFLATPKDENLTITNEDIKTIYKTLKDQDDFQSVVIYTNKGIDIAQDTIPVDLEIIKVPHAIFAELER
ncbi:MAG: site-specific DNA-methyltransferase [Flavobacteriaceae bacterium]|nr:site-specific DNA-methyltransferase [Flavobacteriaceae bacterium]